MLSPLTKPPLEFQTEVGVCLQIYCGMQGCKNISKKANSSCFQKIKSYIQTPTCGSPYLFRHPVFPFSFQHSLVADDLVT